MKSNDIISLTQVYCETGQMGRQRDFCVFLNSISAISEWWDGDNGDNVQWNSIYTGFHTLKKKARKHEEMIMGIWVK